MRIGRKTLVVAMAVMTVLAIGPVDWPDTRVCGQVEVMDQPALAHRQSVSAIVAARRPDSAARLFVHFTGPVSPVQRAELERGGLRLQSYLGNNRYCALVLRDRVDAEALARVSSLDSAGAIKPTDKLYPALARGETPDWVVVPTPAEKASSPQAKDRVWFGAYILFHEDVALADGLRVVKAHDAVVRKELQTVRGLVIELATDQVEALAAEDEVLYLEPALPPMSPVNDSNREITEAGIVQAPPYDLDGMGVSVLVFDGASADATHPDFGGRLTVHDDSYVDTHSTHVACTIGGDGANSAGQYRGMAPGVTIESYAFALSWWDIFLYSNPGDIELDYAEAIRVHGVDLANNSIGTNTCYNYFPCEITGDYGVTASIIDGIVRGAFDRPITVFWANGNERNALGSCSTGHCCRCIEEGVHTPEGYHSTAPPACAKNPIHVGAINSNDESITDFTSWGPCDDGRMKPEIVAPGCQTTDDMGVTSCDVGGGYESYCGTSMASPTATGLAALLLQDYRAHYPERSDPRNATVKALLAHNAIDLGNLGPDYQSGYGAVRIAKTIDFERSGSFFEGAISQGDDAHFLIEVPSATPELKVTLAWDDVPATPLAAIALVNDLDLYVESPSGVRHYPWTLDPENPAAPATRNGTDHLNVIEQVFVESPEDGTWRVSVQGSVVPEGPQPFGVCGTPLIARDCDGNGVPDVDQIAADPALDCSGNGLLDVCEPDCNANGVADSCDILTGTSIDCNENGVPDACDVASGDSADCNTNGRPDECDVAEGLDDDCNGNLVPDACEPDCDGNGVADSCDIAAGTGEDCNGTGVPDSCEIAAGTSSDANTNAYPDECEGPVIYVDSRATGHNNGASWKDAYSDLQRALSVARQAGGIEEIWVAEGTYRPSETGDRFESFVLLDAVAILGGFAGNETESSQRDWMAHRTILSGDIGRPDDKSDNSLHVVSVNETTTSSGVMDGFTIEQGYAGGTGDVDSEVGGGIFNSGGAATFRNCNVRENVALADYPGGGGGMYNGGGACPTVIDCVFADNYADVFGGAMINADHSSPLVVNCQFVENVAGLGGGMYNTGGSDAVVSCCRFESNDSAYGAAVYNVDSTPQFLECVFESNGNDTAVDGGAVYNSHSGPIMTDCVFRHNTCTMGGGAIYNTDDGDAMLLSGCVFLENRSGLWGGAVYNDVGDADFTNCLFVDNRSDTSGGALENYGSQVDLVNCTLHRNHASSAHGAIFVRSSQIVIRNSILWEDEAREIELANSVTLTVSHSCVAGGRDGVLQTLRGVVINWDESNIDTDPGFVRHVYGDELLSQTAAGQSHTSPCVNAGDSSASALELNHRTTRTDGIPDTGTVDLGYHWPVPDCNTNGVPDYTDIAAGTAVDCPGHGNGVPDCCEPDCNTDGVVDTCAVDQGDTTDCDENWIADECEPYEDCNANDVRDTCDIQAGSSPDCDKNAVPDECEPDCDGDGQPDACEIYGPLSGYALNLARAAPDGVTVPSVPELRPADAFTIEAWIRAEGTETWDPIVVHKDGYYRDYSLIIDSYRLLLSVRRTQDGSYQEVVSASPIERKQWYHVAGTFDGSTLTVYVNGEPTRHLASGIVYYEGAGNLIVGRDRVSSSMNAEFDGQIDDMRFWSVARTPAQILNNMYRRLSGDEAGLVGYWRFDEGTGLIAHDSAGDHDGALVFDAQWRELSGDCNTDKTPDECDVSAGTSNDLNRNGVPDECELDCNSNGISDRLDIVAGTSSDCQSNGWPDECDRSAADLDGDGGVDVDDHGLFAECVTGAACEVSGCDPAAYPDPCCLLADYDQDGDVDLIDWAAFQSRYRAAP